MSYGTIDEYRGFWDYLVRGLALSPSNGQTSNDLSHSYNLKHVNDYKAHHSYHKARNLSLIQNASLISNHDKRPFLDSDPLFSLDLDTCPAPQTLEQEVRKEGNLGSSSENDQEKTSKKINTVDFRISTAELDENHRHKKGWDNVREKGSSEEIIDYYHKYVEPELFSTVKPVKIFDIEVNDENRALLTTLKERYPQGIAPLPGQEHSWIGSNIKITEDNYERWRPLQNEYEERVDKIVSKLYDITTSENETLKKGFEELKKKKKEEKKRRENEEKLRKQSGVSGGSVAGLAGLGGVALAAIKLNSLKSESSSLGMIPAPPSKK